MQQSVVIIGLIAGLATVADAQYVPQKTTWPERIAVGMRDGDQLSPLTVEATSNGWVAVRLLSTRPDMGLPVPTSRLIVQAGEVKRFVALVRALLEKPVAESYQTTASARLGTGRYSISISQAAKQYNTFYFSSQACGSAGAGASPPRREVEGLVALLDSAADAAGGQPAEPPTLTRPYYESEVSCGASPSDLNARPAPSASELPPDVGAAFVVDTAGYVERGSIQFLPGTSRRLVRSLRATIGGWRFTPAEIDGIKVRQLVQMPISFAPEPKKVAPGSHTIELTPTRDGWVHFTHANGLPGDRLQEWFRPDSIDAWVAHVRRLNAFAESLPRDTNLLVDSSAALGPWRGVRFSAGFFRHGKALEFRAGATICAGAWSEGEQPVGDATRFADAARTARASRSTPLEFRGIYGPRDVACPAWMEWTRSSRPGFGRVWNYPVGAYPADMRATNARADVMVAMVVDSLGRPELNSIRVMPGADRRAIAALGPTLANLHFRPQRAAVYRFERA